MNRTKTYLVIAFITSIAIGLNAQSNNYLSLELQAYPTGVIPSISYDKSLSTNSYLHLRAGMNIFDHRDLGVQDEEVGQGYGFSLGYRRFFKQEATGFRWTIKSDLWFNSVDWKSNVDNIPAEGNTDIVVLQPTAEIAYVFMKKGIIIAPSIAFGVEWNIQTEGEPTGEGPILLLGLQLGKVF